MRSYDDRDDEEFRPPRPWRFLWILLGVTAVVVLAGGGVVLGMSSIGESESSAEPEAGEASQPVTEDAGCSSDLTVDEAAGLCYLVPDGWVSSSMSVGVGPSSTIIAVDPTVLATAHFGPVANLPVDLPADLPGVVDAIADYACDLFKVGDCAPEVTERDIDGHQAVTATAGGVDGFVTVTVVEVASGYSYATSVADETHRGETDAIHDSLRVI